MSPTRVTGDRNAGKQNKTSVSEKWSIIHGGGEYIHAAIQSCLTQSACWLFWWVWLVWVAVSCFMKNVGSCSKTVQMVAEFFDVDPKDTFDFVIVEDKPA